METRARYALIGLFVSAVIFLGFAFVYWLHAKGGLGQRTVYQVRFENSVAGLLVGSNVLFNGIRVGEVTGLALNTSAPQQVVVTIAVDPKTPIRADTNVSLDFQGLTGAPVLLLTGGSPDAPAPSSPDGGPPLLVAEADAGKTLSQSAREALARLDKILADNTEPIHNAIDSISVFAEALARNSDKVDGILAGLERMTGGASARSKVPIYDLTAVRDWGKCPREPFGTIEVPEPGALMAFNTDKLLVLGQPPNATTFGEAQWLDNIPALVQAKLIESLEISGCFLSVTRPLDGVSPDFRLILDIRDFRIALTPESVAIAAISAQLVGDPDGVVAARAFHETVPLAATDAASAVAALDTAFARILRQLVPWTVEHTVRRNP